MLAPPRAKLQKAMTVSITEEMKALERSHQQRRQRSKKKKKVKTNFAELLNIQVLKKIRKEFVQRGGQQESLTAEEFIDVLSSFIPRSDVDSLYKKIDVNDDGMVEWEEFTGFLISAEGGGTADINSKNMIQQFVLQREQEFQLHSAHQHSDMIAHIAHGKVPYPILATASGDGKVLLWNPKTLQYMQTIDHRDKSSVFLDNVMKSMPRADIARMQSRGTNFSINKNQSYFTGLAILPITGHVCVSSADCCVNVYDFPSLELTGCLSSATDLPTSLNAFAVLDKIRNIKTQYLSVGYSKGKIVVITLDEKFVIASDGPLPKKINQELWNKAVKSKYKWKIHQDWVTQIMYINEINRLVSASLDGTIVLSTLDTQPSARVFNGHESGVRCFGWSNASKIICSAGTDRSVLIWDPFTLQIAHRIETLTSMIISIQISDDSQQIVIVLEEKVIKTWDSLTYEPLTTSEDPSVQLPKNLISASLWVPETELLYTAGNRLCSFRNSNVNNEANADEDDDLIKVLYNRNFYEVVTVTKGGFVNVYFAGDGAVESKFIITTSIKQPGKTESPLSVIDAIFDKTQRRLIVVTNDSNEIQIWNFHSGICLKYLRPRIGHSLSQHPDMLPSDNKTSGFNITCLYYEHTLLTNQKVNKRMLLFGTDLGVVSVLIELPEDISEEPAFNLVAQAEGGGKTQKQISFPETVDVDILPSGDEDGKGGGTRKPIIQQNNSQQQSNFRDVLWINESLPNSVLVAYRDGTVIDWNIDKGVRNVKIKPSDTLKGVSFMAFRRKFVPNNRRGNSSVSRQSSRQSSDPQSHPETSTVSPPLPEEDTLTEGELRTMSEPSKRVKKTEENSNDSPKQAAKRKVVHASPIKKPNADKKMQPKVRTNGPRRITTGETSRTLLATYGTHYEKQVAVAESGQESWTTSPRGQAAGGYFKSAIVGVARKSQDDHASLNPLLPEILSPRKESEPMSFVHGQPTKMKLNSFGRPVRVDSDHKPMSFAGESNVSSLKVSAWGEDPINGTGTSRLLMAKKPLKDTHNNDKQKGREANMVIEELNGGPNADDHDDNKETEIGDALQKMIPPSTPLTHTLHSINKKETEKDTSLVGNRVDTAPDKEHQKKGTVTAPPPSIGVTCMVTLKNAKIAIGACTDSLFRFWDLNTVKVLCSCAVGLELKTVKSGGANPSTLSDMQLSCLTLSDDEEMLIGGYENGEIRIWIISMASINNIRVTQKETMSGMSVPPIQLLNEWTGHESSIRSIEIVALDEENWGSHELYLLSSGQDQGVHLWTISGEHIGSFGTNKSWDLVEKLTWRVSQSIYDQQGFTTSSTQARPSAPSRSKPSYFRHGAKPKKYKIDPNDTETNFFRMATLQRHMEKVKIKNQKKLIDPSTTEIHCDMINASQLRNPIIDVSDSLANPLRPSSSPPRRAKSATSRRPVTTNTKSVKFYRE
mmetsp:Transcript_14488/g.27096  ORF Transcript_14488/g.27096 Transcript_14488/m.27096 type:complete len:1443 (-) Transcript_14488:197-4525(-)